MGQELTMDEAVAVEQAGGWVGNAPWWMISAGLHVVLLLAATLVVIEKLHAVEETEVLVRMSEPLQAIPERFDEPQRDIFTRKGLTREDPVTSASTEPAIWFPEARESDHHESADNEPHRQMKGDSRDFLSYTPGDAGGRGRQMGKTPGQHDVMGVGRGSGGGGRYGGRLGGMENLVARTTATRETVSAVMAALIWLGRHQNPDGSWSADGFSHRCTGAKCAGVGDQDHNVGITSLATLAFLGAGFSHLSKDELPNSVNPSQPIKVGQVVKSATQWLLTRQDAEGCVGERGPEYMYDHAIATLALCEAYGMSGTQRIADGAQKAVDFIVSAQNAGRGWRYRTQSGDNDASVTGWCVMALKSAEMSDLKFPRKCYEGALAFYEEITEKGGYYPVGYTYKGEGKRVLEGKNEKFDDHPAMTAVAVMARIFMQHDKRVPALGGVQLLINDLPEYKANKIDSYYWYYASLALFQYDGPEGPCWKKWNVPLMNALVPSQKTAKDACANGSWTSDDDRWGCKGGRVYTTAINCLTLEVYYRYESIFSKSSVSPVKK